VNLVSWSLSPLFSRVVFYKGEGFIMSNQLYRLEVRRTKTHVVVRAVGRGPRGHSFTLGVEEIPLEAYKAFMAAGGMERFLEPIAVASRPIR
jgi:hypothetical protein